MSSGTIYWPMVFFWAWIASGIVAAHVGTPAWMKRHDPVGFGIIHVTSAMAGPFMWLTLVLAPQDDQDRRLDAALKDRKPDALMNGSQPKRGKKT